MRDRVEHLLSLRAALKQVQDELSLAQLIALFSIAAEPGLSVNDLSERIGAPQQSASRFVAVLLGRYSTPSTSPERKPLIDQMVKQDDPRSRALFLTERGRDIVNGILDAANPETKEHNNVRR